MRVSYCSVAFVLVAVVASLLHGGAATMPSIKEMAQADAKRVPPAWLQPLLDAVYFEECPDHPLGELRAPRSGGGTCNFFCTDCSGAPSAACIAGHPGHKAIQIRKMSGHGVVKVADVEALQLGVPDVQPYLHNGHHVVFLNKRRMAGQGRAGEVRCEEPERALLGAAYRFWSIGCKLKALPEDLEFTISFVVPPKSEGESGDSTSADDDQEGEAGSSAGSNLKTTVAAKPSSGQHQEGVPRNI